MQKQHFFLSPVEVVKVTKENLEEAAEWCGGQVAETASKRVPGRQDKYVWVPTPKGSGISWAFPGMFITKRLVVNAKGEIKATWAVFRRDYFEKNYFETPDDAVKMTWEKANREGKKKPKPAADETQVEKDALQDDMTDILRKAIAEGREIHIHVGEPVVEPALTTEEIEKMDQESRDRINAVNEEIVKGHVKTEVPVENIRAEDPPVRPLSELPDAIEEALAAAPIELSPEPTPEQKPDANKIEILGHDHAFAESCNEEVCPDRYEDGAHSFNDGIVVATPEGYTDPMTEDQFLTMEWEIKTPAQHHDAMQQAEQLVKSELGGTEVEDDEEAITG